MVSRIFAALAVGLLMVTSAVARDLSYDFVRLDIVNTEIDTGPADVDGDGFELFGSVAVGEQFYLFAGYQDIGFDFDIDGTQIELGGGFRHGISRKTDFVATLSYVDLELDSPAGSADEDGLGLSAGVRHLLNDNFEVSGRVNYVDLTDSDTSLEFRGEYFLYDNWVIGAGLEFGDDTTTWLIGGRFNFSGFSR